MAMQMEWIQTILLLGGSLFCHDKNYDGDDDHDDHHQHYHYGEDSTKIYLLYREMSLQNNYVMNLVDRLAQLIC